MTAALASLLLLASVTVALAALAEHLPHGRRGVAASRALLERARRDVIVARTDRRLAQLGAHAVQELHRERDR